jgi:hypothetical protein
MKILHAVESYNPTLGGMQEVVKQFFQRLSARGRTSPSPPPKTVSVTTLFE